MAEEEVNTVKVQAIKAMISTFFKSVQDGNSYYYLNERYADKADILLKRIRAVIDGGK